MTQAIHAFGPDVFGVLVRGIPARLLEVSRSGCLLESRSPVEAGVVSELRLQSGGRVFVDDVRVTRCVRVEGSGSNYLVGAEFVRTRSAREGSIRRAIGSLLQAVTPPTKALPAKKTTRNGRKAEAVSALPAGKADSSHGEGEKQ